jgi:hypothetical protein
MTKDRDTEEARAQILAHVKASGLTGDDLGALAGKLGELGMLRGLLLELAVVECLHGDGCPPDVLTSHTTCLPCKARRLAVESGVADNVNGFLSGKAAALWPGAVVVWRVGPPELWILRRPGREDVGLGDTYRHACAAFYAIRGNEKPKTPSQDKDGNR